MTTLKFYRYFLNATQEEKEKLADYAYELARYAFEGEEMSESALKAVGMDFFHPPHKRGFKPGRNE